MSVIGKSIPRAHDTTLLRGKAAYADDVVVPDCLHIAFVRSPHAHALITRIDTGAARRSPGVAAVLTSADIEAVAAAPRIPLIAAPPSNAPLNTPYILAKTEVCYVGELVAMVVARSRAEAEDAATLVEVDYDPLPVLASAPAALADGAPMTRTELKTNISQRQRVEYGDVTAAFATAAHVFKDEIYIHRGGAHPIEGRGIVVEHRAREEAMTVWSSTQMPHDLGQAIVETIGIDENRLRVITPEVGGGFGAKLCVYPEELAVVCAARATGRSVKWIEDRREHFLGAIQERDQYWSLEIAVDAEAHVLGVRGRLLHDQGAYAFKAANLAYNSATAVTGPYIVPAYGLDVLVTLTNRVPVSSVRGAGYPQSAFVMERLMDRVAREMGLDRAEVRRRNLVPPSKMPYTKPLKARSGASIIYDSGDYLEAQARVLSAIDWDGFEARRAAARREGRRIGIGLANAVKGTGRGPFETGTVRITPSGRISIFTGAVEMGQGLRTAIAQIGAEQFGVDPADVTVVVGDTAKTPLGLGGFASRQLVTAGSSVLLAAREVATKAKKLAAHILEAAESDLVVDKGRVSVVGAPQHGVTLAEIARVLRGAPGYSFPDGFDPGLEHSSNWQTAELAYANACHAVEVEVDIDTGLVTILRYVALQDVGTQVNPMIVDGQVRGGIVHGIGNALFEHMLYDDQGQPTTTTLADYLLVTATELPRIETLYMETPSPINPLGVKGVGEVGTIPAAAAVISAIEDAVADLGIRLCEAPVSPARLSQLLTQKTGS